MPSQTTRSSGAVSKRCLESSNLKVHFARSYANTLKPALRPSLPTLRAQLTCARRPTSHSETRRSFAVDYFIARLTDTTTLDYLLHKRACYLLIWQVVVQMAQKCEASGLSLHAPSTFVTAANTNVDAPALALRTCTPDDITDAIGWQAKCTRDGRVKAARTHPVKKIFVRAHVHRNFRFRKKITLFYRALLALFVFEFPGLLLRKCKARQKF